MLLRSFIWVLIVFTVQAAAAAPHRTSLPKPVGVVFTSLNLWNLIQWQPGRKSTNHTHYNVEYAIYGDKEEGGRRLRWRVKRQCRDIARTWCDLTNETSDLEDSYFARVRAVGSNASSGWTVTGMFSPKVDTVVGPPSLVVSIQDSTAVVQLSGPMRWPTENQTEDIPMARIYPQMTFNLSVYHGGRNQTRHFPLDSGLYRYRLLDYETEFCFSAKARFLSLILHCQASQWHCITTPQDPVIGQLKLVLLGVVVPSCFLFVLSLAGWLLYHFVQGKEQRSPPVLDISHLQTPPRTFSPETVNIILFNMTNTTEIPHTPKPSPRPALPHQQGVLSSYNPQLVPEEDVMAPEAMWVDESPEEHMEPVDYGFVVPTPDQNQPQTLSPESQEIGSWAGIHLQRDPATGLFHLDLLSPLLGLQGRWAESQRLLPYAPQICSERQTSQPGQWQDGTENYSLVGLAPEYRGQGRHREDSQPLLMSGVNLYMAQTPSATREEEREEEQVEDEDEESGHCVDWSPQTGKLNIPSLTWGKMEKKRGMERGVERLAEPGEADSEEILPSVLVRQSSEESESENEVTRLENTWSLQINMDQ